MPDLHRNRHRRAPASMLLTEAAGPGPRRPQSPRRRRTGRRGARVIAARPCAFALFVAPLLLVQPAASSLQPAAEQAPSEAALQEEPTQVERTDAAIRGAVEQRLAALAGIESFSVEVTAGVVTLSGQATDAEWISTAEQVTATVDGVLEVRNELVLSADVRTRLQPVVERLTERTIRFVAFTPLLLIAALIMALALFVARRVRRFERLFQRLTPNLFMRDLARQAAFVLVLLLGLLLALEVLDATSFVAALLGTAGIVGLAIGFAFRDLVENYISSILLSLRQPFAPNDHVEIGGEEGRVVRLTSRATVLITLDGNHLRIPNATVFKSVILNYSRNPTRRFCFAVGVSTEVDLAEAVHLGQQTLEAMEGVMSDPAPFGLITELGDSTVSVKFFGWVDQDSYDFSKVTGEAIRRVKNAFDEAGLDMPEPIYRVRLRDATAVSALARAPESADSHKASTATPAAPRESGPSGAGAPMQSLHKTDELAGPIQSELEAGEQNLLEQDGPSE